jgi:hypothetical protein
VKTLEFILTLGGFCTSTIANLKIMLEHFPIGFGLVKENFKNV